MKPIRIILAILLPALAALTLVVSCRKDDSFKGETNLSASPILFNCEDGDMQAEVETKATVVTSLSSFYAAATKGTAGSETSKWTSYTFNSDGAATPTYSGANPGKWWPDTDESYHFYASNNALTFAAAGTTVSATNTTDVVVAYMPSPTYKTKNTLTFNHIFARIGNVTVSAASGYTISNVSIKITPKTGGTYNIRTGNGKTDATGWSSLTTGSATELANSTPGTKSNDLWLVPGSYTLTASWRAVRGDYTHDYSDVSASASIAIEKGKMNAISITLGGNATEIKFGVTINAWGSKSITGPDFPVAMADDFDIDGDFSVSATKKVRFAKGNLQAVIGSGPTNTYNYTASEWKFADHQYDYIGNAAGNKTFGSASTVDLFGWVGASASYDMYGLSTHTSANNAYFGTSDTESIKTDWGSVPGLIMAVGPGWRTLTATEWAYLINTRSSGATVNGTSNARYTHATVNTDGTGVNGIIIFPNSKTIAAGEATTWGTINGTSAWATKCTSAQWKALESKGCVFLPAAGCRNSTTCYVVGSYGYYYSASPYAGAVEVASYLSIGSGSINPQDGYAPRNYGFSVRLCHDVA